MQRQAILSSILTLALIASTAFAAPIADVSLGASGLDFSLKGAAAGSITLTVAGPGDFYAQKTFDAGQAPYFGLFNEDGSALEPGSYKWNLVENPTLEGSRENHKALIGRTQSGGFSIQADGSIANPDLPEGGFNKDQVFTDDLIVDGSGCFGFDCVNGENFGSDTLRLKENNLRIHFDDTSNSASFPSNDWRIVTNDSSNGGKSYFAVEDSTAGRIPFRIEAGAIANALYVDSAGDVGIGTDTPVVEVHAVDGNTPTVRLEQNGSSGFTAQTWDLAGNEANFFIRDVTNGSKLPFRIEPNTPENTLYLDSTGYVGLGTNSPAAPLHVRTADNPVAQFQNTSGAARITILNSANTEWRLTNSASDTFRITEQTDNTTEWEVDANGTVTMKEQAAAPACVAGGLYVDDSGALCFCDGVSWVVAAGSGTCS